MLVGKVLRLHRLGHPSQVSGREGKNGTHDKIVSYRSVQEPRSTLLVCGHRSTGLGRSVHWELLNPSGALEHALSLQLPIKAGEMMDQTQVDPREPIELAMRTQAEFGEWEQS